MAQSFWSKRKDSLQTAGGYVKATNSVSRPMAMLLTVVGILVVGGLLFGAFAGTRWAITQITDSGTDSTATTIEEGTDEQPATTPSPVATQNQNTNAGSITATSSATTTTPSTPAPAPAPTTTAVASANIPNTGPRENYLVLFLSVALISYTIYHKKFSR